jgi:hypothetical protein
MIPCLKRLGRWSPALIFAASSTLLAQNVDVPLQNWTVPPYQSAAASSGGITTMADLTPGIGFVGVTPCRLVDTRSGSGFPSGYGPPSLTQGVQRNFDLNSQPNCAGIPDLVKAYSLNFTVTNTAGLGFLIVWPQGQTQPLTSSINYVAAQTLANAVIVPAGTGGGVSVLAGISNTDLLIDINGYFTDTYNSNIQFVVTGNYGGQPVLTAKNTSSAANSYAVKGEASGSGGAGSAGVQGLASATGAAGATYGVLGQSNSTSADAAGARGVDGSGAPAGATSFAPAGLRGESTTAYGVLGLSRFVGIRGDVLNTSGGSLAEGRLGYSVSGTNYGVYAIGDVGATGTKSFVMPHPTDPSLVIRYISLEGPEAGTYFRGRGRIDGRSAVIDVPESFRLVTEPDSLSIQLTPIGRNATLWVTDLNLDQIAVQGSRDVEFFYTVNGIRRDYGGFQAIAQSSEFVPESATVRLPESLPAAAKRNLVTNGTYNADGAVNLETAQRLEWPRIWAARTSVSPN